MTNEDNREPTREEIAAKWRMQYEQEAKDRKQEYDWREELPPSKGGHATFKPSAKPLLAGLLNIIAGLLLITIGTFTVIYTISCARIEGENPTFLCLIIIIVLFVPGMLALRSGWNALKRKNWRRVLTGSICAFFGSLSFTTFIIYVIYGVNRPIWIILIALSEIIWIIPIILVALSKKEFS